MPAGHSRSEKRAHDALLPFTPSDEGIANAKKDLRSTEHISSASGIGGIARITGDLSVAGKKICRSAHKRMHANARVQAQRAHHCRRCRDDAERSASRARERELEPPAQSPASARGAGEWGRLWVFGPSHHSLGAARRARRRTRRTGRVHTTGGTGRLPSAVIFGEEIRQACEKHTFAVTMKVVALVSGGKDSCMNMIQCEKFGHKVRKFAVSADRKCHNWGRALPVVFPSAHRVYLRERAAFRCHSPPCAPMSDRCAGLRDFVLQVVALANLYPADEKVDELDSHMYQTVGHHAISVYAACTGLPLFRRKIKGKSLQVRASDAPPNTAAHTERRLRRDSGAASTFGPCVSAQQSPFASSRVPCCRNGNQLLLLYPHETASAWHGVRQEEGRRGRGPPYPPPGGQEAVSGRAGAGAPPTRKRLTSGVCVLFPFLHARPYSPSRPLRFTSRLPLAAQGVSCGAILSDYQRLRVEAVCASLGLTSLAYLWQRNQARSLRWEFDNEAGHALLACRGSSSRRTSRESA